MKNKLSKIVAVLLMVATTLGGAVTGFAAPGSRPASGDLTIHKYWAETANDVKDEGDGEELAVPPTNPAVKGIQFDVYKLTPVADAPATPPSDKDGWTYSRTGTELTVTKDGTAHKYSLELEESTVGENGKTNDSGELKYAGLAAGYYYVEENLAASSNYVVTGTGNEDKKITSASKPFIVAVPMTNAAGDGWNIDVHVYPKNEGLNPEKTPSVPSINVGDTVTWTVSANVPSNFSAYTKFDIVDTLDERLSFANNVSVKGTSDSWDNIVTLDPAVDYGVTGSVDTPGETIRISLTQDGINKLAGFADVTKVVVSFDTAVNGNIESDDENTIKNEAEIEFENDSTTETSKTPPTEVHTGEIKIDKTYSGGTVEKSAQFQLAATDHYAERGEYYKVLLDPANKYIVDIVAPGEPGYDTAKNWVALPSQADTGEDLGLVGDTFYVTSFEGVRTYTESGGVKTFDSYFLVETKAPDGYNLLDGPVKVTFTEEDSKTQHIHTESIENKRGFTLPNTGGVGTLLLVVFGIILIGLAIILTMNKKKKTV